MVFFSSSLPTKCFPIPSTPFWSITHSGWTIHFLNDPDSTDPDFTRLTSIFHEKVHFWVMRQSLSVTQAQNRVFIFDSFSTISHMRNQSWGLIDFFLCHDIYFHKLFLPCGCFPLSRPLSHARLVCSIIFFH